MSSISQVYEGLESGDARSVPSLRQQKLLLSGKLDLLLRLDDELIEMVVKNELDHEVEQADVIKGNIGLCTIDIDQALECTSSQVLTDLAVTETEIVCLAQPSRPQTLTQLTRIPEGCF